MTDHTTAQRGQTLDEVGAVTEDRTDGVRGTMRAVIAAGSGPAEVMTVREVEIPVPGPGEVLIEVLAAGVGAWDLKRRSGAFGPVTDPFGLGGEVAGIVRALGSGVSAPPLGTRVFGYSTFSPGGYAEFAACPAEDVGVVPPTLSDVEAAAAPVAALTAQQLLVATLELERGDRLLVTGAAGGVGSMAVQLAHALGIRVFATAAAGAEAFVRALGAEAVFDYRGDWVGDLYRVLPEGVDAAMDNVSGPTGAQVVSALRKGGRLGQMVPGPSPQGAAERRIDVRPFSTAPSGAQLTALGSWFDNVSLRVPVHAVFDLDDVVRAHQLLAQGGVRGKLVLAVGGTAPPAGAEGRAGTGGEATTPS